MANAIISRIHSHTIIIVLVHLDKTRKIIRTKRIFTFNKLTFEKDSQKMIFIRNHSITEFSPPPLTD